MDIEGKVVEQGKKCTKNRFVQGGEKKSYQGSASLGRGGIAQNEGPGGSSVQLLNQGLLGKSFRDSLVGEKFVKQKRSKGRFLFAGKTALPGGVNVRACP